MLKVIRPQDFTAGTMENYEFRKPQENSWYPVQGLEFEPRHSRLRDRTASLLREGRAVDCPGL